MVLSRLTPYPGFASSLLTLCCLLCAEISYHHIINGDLILFMLATLEYLESTVLAVAAMSGGGSHWGLDGLLSLPPCTCVDFVTG